MFKIGEEVVALTGQKDFRAQPRKKGEIYEVLDISYCPNTGGQAINIAGSSPFRIYLCHCGEVHESKGKHWTQSIHFAPLQTTSEEADMNAALTEVFERELFA